MKPRLLMAAATSDATAVMIASAAMEAGGVKKSPRARAAVDAGLWFFIPMAISHAQVSSDTTHGSQTTNAPLGEDKTANPVQCILLLLAPLRHANSPRQCPLSKVTRKTSTQTEFF
jgi:hypothetical protein